jgi:tetratricopeptide (TPR) repeat protein
MKKLLIVAVVMLMTTIAFSQKLELSSAAQAYKGAQNMMGQAMQSQDFSKVKGKLLSAKKYIDIAHTKQLASGGLKTKEVPKLWHYRSLIYLNYIMMAASEKDVKADAEANEDAYEKVIFESAENCKKTDLNGTAYWEPLKLKLNLMRWGLASEGVKMFNEKKYEDAYGAFTGASKLAEVIEMKDTLSFYNAGLASEKLEKYDEAAMYYQKCADLGYQGALTYVLLSQALNKQKKHEEANAALRIGLEKYPSNLDLIKEQLNGYLLTEQYDKAEESMAKVIAKEPNNAVLHFSIGTIYDNLKRYEDAEKAYDAALAIDPEYFDAIYSKGVSYFNQAVELYGKVETITNVVEQDTEIKRAEALMNSAMPILEKAHGMNAEDRNTMTALKQIYGRLDLEDKYMEMKAKLKG